MMRTDAVGDLLGQPIRRRRKVVHGEQVFDQRRGTAQHAKSAGFVGQLIERQVRAAFAFDLALEHCDATRLLIERGVGARFVFDKVST